MSLGSIFRKKRSTSINFQLLILIPLVSVMLFVIGFYRTEIDTDIIRSLPQDDPVVSDALYILRNRLIQDHLIIDISDQKGELDILVESAEWVEKRLKKSGLFKNVGMKEVAHLIPDLAFYVADNLPVMFSESELNHKIRPLLDSKKIQKKLSDIHTRLSNLEGIGQADLISKDPLNLKDFIMAKLAYLLPAKGGHIYKQHLVSADGNHLLVMANPISSSTDTAFGRKVTDLMSVLSQEVSQKFGGKGSRVVLTPMGAYRVALDNEQIVRRDVQRAIIVATIGIMLLLIFAFPRPYIGLLSLLPAIAGVMTAFFVFSLLHKSISLMVLGFGGAIISISVDHAIAYLLFLDRPSTTYGWEASKEIRAVGLLAVLTTAGAFTVLSISGFPILEQLGQFTALGISFSFIFVHAAFPAIFPKMPPAPHRVLTLQSWVDRFALSGKKGALVALIFALFIGFYARPKFNVSLSAMNTVSRETTLAEKRVSHVWGDLFNRIYIMSEGQSITELQKKGDRLLDIMDQKMHSDMVSPGFLPSLIFPGEERRRQNVKAWQNFWTRRRVAALKKSIEAASFDLGFTAEAFEPFYQALKPHTYDPKRFDIPEKFFELMGIAKSSEKNGWTHVSALTPGPSYDAETLYAELSASGKLFDPTFFSEKLGQLLFSTFMKMLVIIGLSVTILLFFFFLDWTLTFISLLPVLFALVSTLGTLKLMGKPLDIPGVMLAIVVIGMGIDYSLFFVRSYQRYGTAAHPFFGLIRMTVFMASTSTLIGFGVLCLAEHALLKSAGLISLLGIGYSLIGAFVILPPVLNHRFRPREEDNTGSGDHPSRILRRYRNMEAYPRLFARFKLHFDPMFLELPHLLASCKAVDTILDIGCGFGVPASWMLEWFPESKIYAFDPDPGRVRIAGAAIGKRGWVKSGRAPNIPAFPEPADLIIMLDVIHYLDDAELTLTITTLCKKLSGHGRLIIRVPLPPKRRFPWIGWVENFKLKLCGMPSYYRSVEKNKTLLMKAGFRIERTESSGKHKELVWFIGKTGS